MEKNQIEKKYRQLKVLSIQVQKLIGSNRVYYSSRINHLLIEIKKLIRQLSGKIPSFKLKHVLGSLSIFLGISFTTAVHAQNFAPSVQNPFGIEFNDFYYVLPTLADLDGDGDFDLIAGGFLYNSYDYGYDVYYLENIGTKEVPKFSVPVKNPFGISLGTYDIGLIEMADIDGDGDLDMFVPGLDVEGYNYIPKLVFLENIGDKNNPAFAVAIEDPFSIDFSVVDSYINVPSLIDVDNDGDLDLFGTSAYGTLNYYENVGSNIEPVFNEAVQSPFGFVPEGYMIKSVFVDIDDDGDFDIIGGSQDYGKFVYYENSGTSASPNFELAKINPFGLSSVTYIAFPTVADLDADGDPDLLVGEEYGQIQYFENISISNTSTIDEINIHFFPNPAVDFVQLDTHIDVKFVEIYNISGVLLQRVDANWNKIDVRALNNGSYILKISAQDGHHYFRKFEKFDRR